MTQRGTCQRGVLVPADPSYYGNCKLPQDHEGNCVWIGPPSVRFVAVDDFEDFTAVPSRLGTGIYQVCPDEDCPSPRSKGMPAQWTIRAQIDAATDHNRRYHS